MGYDMYIHNEIPGVTEAVAAARKQWDQAVAARDALDAESGSYWSPEEAALPEEQRAELGEAKHARMNELLADEGWEMARFRVFSVPPSEAWFAAQMAVIEAGDAMDDANKHYFRLNIWGMGEAGEILDKFGMLKSDGGRSWPDPPEMDEVLLETIQEALYDGRDEPNDYVRSEEFKAALAKSIKEWNEDSDYRKEQGYPELAYPTDDLIQAVVTHRERINEVLAAHDADIPGIAVHKLGSNDGWLVTPEECVGAVKMWDLHPDADRERVAEEKPYVARFVEWIRLAADHGGFTVH